METVIHKPAVKWLLGFGFWTFLGLSFASQFYISSAKAGFEVSWGQAVSYSLVDWYVVALLSVPVMQLARRFRFEAGKWVRSLGVHIFASVAFSLTYIVLRAGIGQWQSEGGFMDAFRPLLVKTWHFNLLIYWVIVAVSQGFDYYRMFRERELRALELEKHLAQARLQALQMQLNPHFLFNTLHSISSLMHQNVPAADRMIMLLGDLLRATLKSSDVREVPLRQELEFIQRYLEIEQTRFGDRLALEMDIAPNTLAAQVPNLILQPLVENAIHHGIGARTRPGRIAVRARCQEDQLVLEVSDNGAGLSSTEPFTEGIGLSNTRARLQELYGPAHRFQLRDVPEGGLLVELNIPFRL